MFAAAAFCVAGPFPPARAEAATVPLAAEDAVETGDRIVRFLWLRQGAEEALRLGFPSLSAGLFQRAEELLPEGDPREGALKLSLSTALIAAGRIEEAAARLEDYSGEVNDAVLLRRAIFSWHGERWGQLRYRLGEIAPGALPREDLGWYFFLQGYLREVEGKSEQAERLYRRSEEDAVSAAQRAQFAIARYRAFLMGGEPDEELLERLRDEIEANEGTPAVYRFAQEYVLVLDALGRRGEALEEAAAWRERVPPVEKEARDRFLFLEGLIAGSDSAERLEAFKALLASGETRELQRAALYELGRDLREGEDWETFEDLLTELIEMEEPHVLIDELLVFRSRALFARRRFDEATEDAQTVLSQYPGSRLKMDALRLLGHIAWEDEKYRTAADYVTQLRDEIPEGERRAELGVLVADCYFRAEDYENAADAYGNVLRERPERLVKGQLLFQRVMAELRGGRTDRAREHLDEARFHSLEDLDYVWQAEWNLLKSMRKQGRMEDAYGRVTELLGGEEDYPLPRALRVRFLWLRAQLAYESGRVEETLPLLDLVFAELAREEGERDLPEDLRRAVREYANLMRARAFLESDRPDEAVALLQELREGNRDSEPAVYSYLVEARYHASVGRMAEAQRLLTALADIHPDSPYAPIALYEAAVNTEQSGTDEDYEERAIGRFERLIETYPNHELVFYARLKQADLLRRMNRFGTARQIYESLENRYPDHPDWFQVKISLADTFLAQGETVDPSFLERALVTLERLYDLPQLTPEMRAEAGFKYAFAYEKIGNFQQAREVYWLVIATILEDEGTPVDLGSKGRYWVSRSVFHLGRLLEESEHWNEAREAYSLIFSHRLPGESLARSRLMPLTER